MTVRRHATALLAIVPSLVVLAGADTTAMPSAAMGEGRSAPAGEAGGHSWELPPLTVQGQAPSPTRDDDLVGAYAQPRWSTTRRFTEVRTFVIPEGQFDFEYWLFVASPSRRELDDAKAAGAPRPKPTVTQQYEAELGLGHRLQADIYQVYEKDGASGTNELAETKFELRYALADWDKLFANPTLYAEWIQDAHGADQAEYKLLLCDDLGPRWMWATNLVWQQRLGDARDRSLEWNSAIAYDAIDGTLSIGVEANVARASAIGDDGRRDHHDEIGVGPSLRWYPIPHAHVIVAEFIGLDRDAPESKTVGIVGWEF